MLPENKTIAYIDGANLHRGVLSLGWRLDYSRFRIWLSDKYGVGLVYLFVGLIPKYKDRYTQLQKDGFTLVYKEVIYDGNGRAKGNCDADLVTQAMRDSYEGMARRVVLVTSDGDYAPLVKFWLEKKQLLTILSPAPVEKCSILLKRTDASIAYIKDQKNLLESLNEKAPGRDEPGRGLFRGDK